MRLPVALGDLLPASARLCLQIERNFLEKFPRPAGSSFLLGLSGGADSVSLLIIFNILARRHDFILTAMHINHALRQEADNDADFVSDLCSKLSVHLKTVKIDVAKLAQQKNCGLEEAGRSARHAALTAQAKETGAIKILLAHHATDLTEDILMRYIRGAGWPALGGMAEMTEHFYRPLLSLASERLKKFLQSEGIPWREDESNQSMAFLRNRIRGKVLPLLKQENPSLELNALNLQTLASTDRDYWQQQMRQALDQCPWELVTDNQKISLTLSKALLENAHAALRMRLYHHALKYLRQFLPESIKAQARMETLLLLDNAFIEKRRKKIFQLPGQIRAIIEKNGVVFQINAWQKL